MERWLWIGGGAAGVLTAVLLLLINRRRTTAQQQSPMLAVTICGAIGVLGLVVGWLLATDPNTAKAEALKTGGVASGALIALYALWLNDRRRRVEEDRREIERERQNVEYSRQQLENRRANHDLERVADERFARSVELLGHEADQVRVGALHALVGLARGHPKRTQTVLDVLCSYLRRPFHHPNYPLANCQNTQVSTAEVLVADRERQVRLTAQRLIAATLQNARKKVICDLDLTGATLEGFSLQKCEIGAFSVPNATLLADFSLDEVVFREYVDLTESSFYGKANFNTSTFHREVRAVQAQFHDDAIFSFIKAFRYFDLEAAVFHGAALFDESVIETLNLDLVTVGEMLGMQNTQFTNPEDRLRLPKGWVAELDRNGIVVDLKAHTIE